MFSARRVPINSRLARVLSRRKLSTAAKTGARQRRARRVAFFAPLADPGLLKSVDFYKADIDAWREAGHNVRVSTTIKNVDLRAEIYFVWWWTHALPVVLLARLRRKPVFITGTFNWDTKAPGSYSDRPRHHRILIDLSAKLATQNLIPSKAELVRLQTEYGMTNGSYFPHRVRTPGSQSVADAKTPVTQQLKRRPFILSMAWSGKLNLRRKCVFETIDAFALIAEEHPRLRLVLAGNEGDGADELRRTVDDHCLSDRIALLGSVTEGDREWLMANCTMFVSPSRYEGFGLAIAEAAAFSKPVITNDVGAIAEVLGPHGAFYSRSTSAADIATAIDRALTDELQVKRVVTAAEESVARFSLEAKVEQVRQIVERGECS